MPDRKPPFTWTDQDKSAPKPGDSVKWHFGSRDWMGFFLCGFTDFKNGFVEMVVTNPGNREICYGNIIKLVHLEHPCNLWSANLEDVDPASIHNRESLAWKISDQIVFNRSENHTGTALFRMLAEESKIGTEAENVDIMLHRHLFGQPMYRVATKGIILYMNARDLWYFTENHDTWTIQAEPIA